MQYRTGQRIRFTDDPRDNQGRVPYHGYYLFDWGLGPFKKGHTTYVATMSSSGTYAGIYTTFGDIIYVPVENIEPARPFRREGNMLRPGDWGRFTEHTEISTPDSLYYVLHFIVRAPFLSNCGSVHYRKGMRTKVLATNQAAGTYTIRGWRKGTHDVPMRQLTPSHSPAWEFLAVLSSFEGGYLYVNTDIIDNLWTHRPRLHVPQPKGLVMHPVVNNVLSDPKVHEAAVILFVAVVTAVVGALVGRQAKAIGRGIAAMGDRHRRIKAENDTSRLTYIERRNKADAAEKALENTWQEAQYEKQRAHELAMAEEKRKLAEVEAQADREADQAERASLIAAITAALGPYRSTLQTNDDTPAPNSYNPMHWRPGDIVTPVAPFINSNTQFIPGNRYTINFIDFQNMSVNLKELQGAAITAGRFAFLERPKPTA